MADAAGQQMTLGTVEKRSSQPLTDVFASAAASSWRARQQTVKTVHGGAETSLVAPDLPRSVNEQLAAAPSVVSVRLYVNGQWLPFGFMRDAAAPKPAVREGHARVIFTAHPKDPPKKRGPPINADAPEDLDIKAGENLAGFFRSASVRYSVFRGVFVRATAKLTRRRGGFDQAFFASFAYDPPTGEVTALSAELHLSGPDEAAMLRSSDV